MKIETILNAMQFTNDRYAFGTKTKRRARQHRTFRDRIIRMDAEKDAEIKRLKDEYKEIIYEMGRCDY